MNTTRRGSALLITLTLVVALSLVAGTVLQSTLPRFTAASRTAAWQEAFLAAETGVDLAVGDLNKYVPRITSGAWTGWKTLAKQEPGSDATGDALKPKTIDTNTDAGKTGLAFSDTIVRDNVSVTPTGGISAMVDVQLTALYPVPNNTDLVWVRVRSMGTAALPPRTTEAGIDALDTSLRRLSLLKVRASLDGDVNIPQTISTPSASRILEVVCRPLMPFENAITTEGYLELPNSNNFLVDSYDSTDKDKSTNGLYDESKRQSNGNIASNGKDSTGDPIRGDQIDVNGRQIYGDVLTNGGTVDGVTYINGNPVNVHGEVSDDFSTDLDIITPPNPLVNLQSGSTFLAGPAGSVKTYRVNGNQGSVTITAPAGATEASPGEIVIVITGDLSIGTGKKALITVPPNVKAKIYVGGDIDFGNGEVNSTSSDSRRAANLQIYGYGESGTLTSNGNPAVYAAVYAPTYNATIKGGGNGAWFGSLVAKTVNFNGGGGSSFHYDEALGTEGPVRGFQVSRYFEDMRR